MVESELIKIIKLFVDTSEITNRIFMLNREESFFYKYKKANSGNYENKVPSINSSTLTL